MTSRTPSRSQKKKRDEIEFPIRLRYDVPDSGYGTKMDQVLGWLQANEARCGWNSDSLPGAGDAASFYFMNIDDAIRFAELMRSLEIKLSAPAENGWNRPL